MIPNKLYTNKNNKFSKFKEFIGIYLTSIWDWTTLIFTVIIPWIAAMILIISHKHLALVIDWVLIVAWLLCWFANIMNCYFVEQYCFTRNVDAKEPDKKGLLYSLLGLNFVMFVLIFIKIPKSERHFFHTPTAIFKHKEKQKKAKKSKNKKEKK